jgi:glycosyltransferase involved in cell wall biosynthesis
MMHLFINSLAASAGGGLTYIRNVIPHLAATQDLRVTVALGPSLRQEFPSASNIEFVELETSAAKRFWFEQSKLPEMIRRRGADVLLSTGNFALRKSPIPQILLSRNSLYTSADFYRDLISRGEYRTWLDTRFRAMLARRSIFWADCTVAPSEAFAAELRQWTGRTVRAIHHGFDREAFFSESGPLGATVEAKLKRADENVRLLFVSHYNYYRNFETLIRALPLLRQLLPNRSVTLFVTCKLSAGENPGEYRPNAAAQLVKNLGVENMVVELGSIPYRQLHRLYERANLYVTPAYTETFAHPLVEAMASGLPVVASDLAVHREICGEAAAYFPRFSAEELAETVAQVTRSPEMLKSMADTGSERARQFSWKTHVEKILELCRMLIGSKRRERFGGEERRREF